jgi:hypothetical protein
MSINTDPISSLAGTFWMEINAPNTNTNAVVMKMGEISYDFDLVPSSTVVRGIGGIQGAMKIDFYDQLSNRGSMYTALEDSIGVYDGLTATTVPVAPTTLYLLPRGESNVGNAYRWPFDLRFTEVSIDERSQTTTATFVPRGSNVNINVWSTGTATNNFPNAVAFRRNSLNFTSYYAGDFIYDIISELDTDVGNTTLYLPAASILGETLSNQYIPYLPREEFVSNSNFPTYIPATMVIGPDQEWSGDNTVYQKVVALAGIDQSIFGSAFNVNYFMGKRNNTHNVELSIDDIEDLKFKASPRSINSIIYNLSNTNIINASSNMMMGNGFPAIYNSFGSIDAWAAADQQINVTIAGYQPHLSFGITTNGTGSNVVNGDALYSAFLSFPGIQETLWCGDAAATTAFAVGAWTSNAGVYMIEADIFGVDKLRPYEVIKFDNTVPLRYQGKHFRPTSVSYDLKADRVRVTAYQIDTFEVAPPPPPPPPDNVNIIFCESGSYMVEVTFNGVETYNVNTSDNGSYMLFDLNTWQEAQNILNPENGNYMAMNIFASNETIFDNSLSDNSISSFDASSIG